MLIKYFDKLYIIISFWGYKEQGVT